ncbi:MAG TPA: class I SAM-dependent methyltransferase [Planctomycetaceae bacterium]|nr:class I SAM-dependent methyltransferase [Planctomycetaceae bacterium]
MSEVDGVDKLAGATNGDGCSYGGEYLKWKAWAEESFGTLMKKDSSHFSAEIGKTGTVFALGSKVLEIGYGNGSFLAFAKERRWEVVGTEVSTDLVEIARRKGFNVHHTDNLRSFPDDSFDLIVAFDVLEHIPEENLPEFLHQIVRTLKNNGCFVARFPNGDSPFGLPAQNGDITHTTAIGSGKVRYFAGSLSVELLYVGAESQPLLGVGLARFIHRLVALPVKKIINTFVNMLFFRSRDIAFCSPNLILIYRSRKSIPQ